jgi:uncharacterized ion transporter superfamily protein YfcC
VGVTMKFFLIISIFIVSLYADDFKKEKNTFAVQEKKLENTNNFNNYKKIPKFQKDLFDKDSIEVNGSITIEHIF